jgi:hypothetical protein
MVGATPLPRDALAPALVYRLPLTEQQGVSLSIGLPSALFCLDGGLGKRPQWFRLGPFLLKASMRIFVAITIGVCCLAVSGCSRSSEPSPVTPRQSGQAPNSDRYGRLPSANSHLNRTPNGSEQNPDGASPPKSLRTIAI